MCKTKEVSRSLRDPVDFLWESEFSWLLRTMKAFFLEGLDSERHLPWVATESFFLGVLFDCGWEVLLPFWILRCCKKCAKEPKNLFGLWFFLTFVEQCKALFLDVFGSQRDASLSISSRIFLKQKTFFSVCKNCAEAPKNLFGVWRDYFGNWVPTSDARGHSQTAHCGPLKFMGVCGSEYLIFLQTLGVGDAKWSHLKISWKIM